MGKISLQPQYWYAAELIGEEFGKDIRSFSPIRVDRITPKGGRTFSLAFYHANYPEGVRDKFYNLQTIERNACFVLARSASHKPARILLIYNITNEWLRQHFGVTIPETEDAQTWLARNA